MNARRSSRSSSARAATGFTLIEVLVALFIMALALALLYRTLGSNTQAVAISGQYQRATMLAQSLLSAHDALPESGWNAQGQSGGFDWQVSSQPYASAPQQQRLSVVPLHELNIRVSWRDGEHERVIALSTLRPQRHIDGSANALPDDAGAPQ
ncbi:type II secretion system protein [Vandammella animalimorsus]|uniref:Type II secretion system protein n=1 Tax=Vandammella animalimorsus TaxID=2029117 RepID=A0A3M6RQS1_9BURK|nr:prepilin-type N-terminal cleavage/methylation domain-containing protein [Vandammella animalimorsus]RMX17560.1 type II secretion system protein [Vandammella animalimorsus]